jgi:anti-sigma B factor antagonist
MSHGSHRSEQQPQGSVTVEVLDESVLVRAVGDLDVATAPELISRMTDAVRSHPVPDRVVVDLAGVSFLDPRGLGALIEARNRITESGSRLVLARPSAAVQRILALTELDGVLPVEGPG